MSGHPPYSRAGRVGLVAKRQTGHRFWWHLKRKVHSFEKAHPARAFLLTGRIVAVQRLVNQVTNAGFCPARQFVPHRAQANRQGSDRSAPPVLSAYRIPSSNIASSAFCASSGDTRNTLPLFSIYYLRSTKIAMIRINASLLFSLFCVILLKNQEALWQFLFALRSSH